MLQTKIYTQNTFLQISYVKEYTKLAKSFVSQVKSTTSLRTIDRTIQSHINEVKVGQSLRLFDLAKTIRHSHTNYDALYESKEFYGKIKNYGCHHHQIQQMLGEAILEYILRWMDKNGCGILDRHEKLVGTLAKTEKELAETLRDKANLEAMIAAYQARAEQAEAKLSAIKVAVEDGTDEDIDNAMLEAIS